MAKKRRSRKKTKSENSFITLVIIIVLLAIVSVVTAYFILGDDEKQIPDLIENEAGTQNKSDVETHNNDAINESKTKTDIDGTWVSNYDGAMLTITGNTFSLEMPSVDASSKVNGSLAVEKTIVSFTNTSGNKACIGKEGHYNYSFIDGELMLNKIKDPCDRRSERMTETWFRL